MHDGSADGWKIDADGFDLGPGTCLKHYRFAFDDAVDYWFPNALLRLGPDAGLDYWYPSNPQQAGTCARWLLGC